MSYTKCFFAQLRFTLLSHLLSVVMPSVIMLSGIMLNVVEPPLWFNTKENNKTRTSCKSFKTNNIVFVMPSLIFTNEVKDNLKGSTIRVPISLP